MAGTSVSLDPTRETDTFLAPFAARTVAVPEGSVHGRAAGTVSWSRTVLADCCASHGYKAAQTSGGFSKPSKARPTSHSCGLSGVPGSWSRLRDQRFSPTSRTREAGPPLGGTLESWDTRTQVTPSDTSSNCGLTTP